jgi:anti-sigma regulatory factor (Ser/Thr protein kinase)
MIEPTTLHFEVVEGLTSAGEASSAVKKVLKELGFSDDIVRRASICLYEGEINMVIHANGGVIDVFVSSDKIEMVLTDEGVGIGDIEMAIIIHPLPQKSQFRSRK